MYHQLQKQWFKWKPVKNQIIAYSCKATASNHLQCPLKCETASEKSDQIIETK